MSLLTICQAATDEVGLKRASSVIGSSDKTAKRCLRYAIRTGRELVKMSIPYLVKEATFSTVASQVSYDMEDDLSITDFDHFVPFTHWNRTTDRRQYPIGADEWQLYQSGLASVSINDRFRIRGSDRKIFIEPTPTSVETLAFEYVSKNYCKSAGEAEQSVWTADTDTGILDEELFELGIIWRLLNRMGQPYGEEKAEYQSMLNTIQAQINPMKVRLDGRLPESSNIPDANFPSS